MVFIVLISWIFFHLIAGSRTDDYLEQISVNAGETASFICDLPEKYANQRVGSPSSTIDQFFGQSISIIKMITSSFHLGNLSNIRLE
jgi:hypothetical protein